MRTTLPLLSAAALLMALSCAAPRPMPISGPPQANRELPAPEPSPEMEASPSASKMLAPPPSPVAGQARAADTQQGSEEYKGIKENSFIKAKDQALSTFSVDVDTASYSNVRRFIAAGSLPPVDAVRMEELVNYFDYNWAQPSGAQPIAISSEAALCPWQGDHQLLAVALRTKSVDAGQLPPVSLTFLIDSSGSMSDPDKLPLVKRAFALLSDTLRSRDSVAIVSYAGSAGLVLPPTRGNDAAAINAALDRLEAGGSTAGGEGITLAYQTALSAFKKGGNNRVVLATDGDFNVGVSSEDALVKLVSAWRDKGIYLSVLGVGTGNLKDSRMKSFADAGNGNYAYIDSLAEARRVLVEQMGATLTTVAKDVKIQVAFDPELVESYRLIGYETRIMAAEDFVNDKKDAGELGAGHRVTALYELVLKGGAAGSLGEARVRYKKPQADESLPLAAPLCAPGPAWRAASNDLRFAAGVAAYGLLLRRSPNAGSADWKLVLELADSARGEDLSGRRAEFIDLATKASKLSRSN